MNDKLITDNLPFVYKMAARYTQHAEYEDLVQEGVLGLMRAAETYDPDRGVKFLTYAAYWIKVKMSEYAKGERKQEEIKSKVNSMVGPAVEDGPEEDLLTKDFKDKAIDILEDECIKARDIDIIVQRYLSDSKCTLQELADKYSLSRERIRQIEKKVINRLKNRFAKETQDDR